MSGSRSFARCTSYRGRHSEKQRNIPLFSLPNEILLLTAQYLTPKSTSSFIQTSRYLALLLTPYLHSFALRPEYGETALWFAASTGQKELVRRILERGSRTVVRGATMEEDLMLGPVLHSSPAKVGDWLVELLLERTWSVVIHDRRCGGTAIHWASHYGHANIVRSLLEKNIDIKVKDGRGRTALHWAAKAGHEEVVRMLLDNGAFVDSQDNYGDTALHRATEQTQAAVVKILLESGANVAITERDGATALHWAGAYGKDVIALMLLENGADTNVLGRNEETPLHQAAAYGHVGVARILLKFGAKTETLDEFGWTPLHHAIANGHESVAVLLESKAEVSSRDRKRKRVAIVKAICDMNMRAVRWLLSRIRTRSL